MLFGSFVAICFGHNEDQGIIMISDLASKLTQVIEQNPKDVLYDFFCSYAQEHKDLAMSLRRVGGCLRE